MDHAEFSGDAGLQWRDGIERETSMEERTGEKLSAVAQLPFAVSFAVAVAGEVGPQSDSVFKMCF